jgi:hypothetical protein
MYARSKLAIVAVAFGLAIGAYGASAFADDGMPYVSPDGHGNCPADSTPTLFQGGIMRCHLHPRSQADCPLKYTFRVIAGRGGCTPNLDSPDYVLPFRNIDPPAIPCEHDADCSSGFCGGGFCAPDNAKQ